MRRFILASCAAAGLSLSLVVAAGAAGKGVGSPGGFTGTPPGFGSQGGHRGFEPFTPAGATSPTNLPPGWDEGNAPWKKNLQKTPPVLSCPPGLKC